MFNSLVSNPFYFLRHGQTDWNVAHRFQGQTDIPLNATGLQQAQDAAQLLVKAPITIIISSPLTRARQTAEIVSLVINKPIVIVDDLKEASWGILEGTNDTVERNAWRNGKEIEGAELYSDFQMRVIRGINQALAYQGPVLIVSHGGLYSTLQQILQLPITGTQNCVPIYHEPPRATVNSWGSYSIEPKQNVMLE